MEILDFVLYLVIIITVFVLAMRYLGAADARARIELQKRLQKTNQYTSGNQRRQEQEAPQQPPAPEIGPWIPTLLEGFGIDPEVVFEEEMPAELKMILPLAKGYISAQGGLPGLMAKMQAASATNQGNQGQGAQGTPGGKWESF